MDAINELEVRIREFPLPELGDTTIGAHAVVQTLDPRTVAIVVFCGRHTQLIEQAIRNLPTGFTDVATANDVITITT
ncbi:hypothetical protein [Nocardia sp. NPDC046763]|uniref:hypothetical protein n=1 Tax=Nocardia sp. NPDC046763 TaxID=3155256 RepID=UPI0033EA70E1